LPIDFRLFLATNPPIVCSLANHFSFTFHPVFTISQLLPHFLHPQQTVRKFDNFGIEFSECNLPWADLHRFGFNRSCRPLFGFSTDSCCLTGASDSWQRKWFNFRSATMENHRAAFGSCEVWKDCTTCNWNYVYFCFCSHLNRQWVWADDGQSCSWVLNLLILPMQPQGY